MTHDAIVQVLCTVTLLTACSARSSSQATRASAGGSAPVSGGSGPTAPTQGDGSERPDAGATVATTLVYDIDRGAVPPQVGFRSLTLKVSIGTARSVSATVDGSAGRCAYDPPSGEVLITTAGARVVLSVAGGNAAIPGFGQVSKAALEGDKKWAWSHGFDDDVGFKVHGIPAMEARGWRGTLYVMNKDDSALGPPGEAEAWRLNEDDLRTYRNGGTLHDSNSPLDYTTSGGWSIGNHSWSHRYVTDFATPEQARADVVRMQDRLRAILGGDAATAYRVIAFAAPMVDPAYVPIVRDLRDSDPGVGLLFLEGQGDPVRQIDGPLDTSAPIGRAPTYETGTGGADDPLVIIEGLRARMDATHHYWFNTLEHAVDDAYPRHGFFKLVQAIHDRWGPRGTDEVWVAPADRVYSYLLVRDLSRVTRR